jgi:hypothetical protein
LALVAAFAATADATGFAPGFEPRGDFVFAVLDALRDGIRQLA